MQILENLDNCEYLEIDECSIGKIENIPKCKLLIIEGHNTIFKLEKPYNCEYISIQVHNTISKIENIKKCLELHIKSNVFGMDDIDYCK